jgi:hypothetical protein
LLTVKPASPPSPSTSLSDPTWLELESDLRKVMLNVRGRQQLSVLEAGKVAHKIVHGDCQWYLMETRLNHRNAPPEAPLIRNLLANAATKAAGLEAALELLSSYPIPGFSKAQRRKLTSFLQRLQAAPNERRLHRLPKAPGRQADDLRRRLNASIAKRLLDAGVTPTTAKTGVLARTIELVGGATGVPAGTDVHKQTRIAVRTLQNGALIPHKSR